jgi:glycosyltransferase involved in cell wall biosynthesis
MIKVALVHNYYQQPGGEDQVFSQERCLLESRGHKVVTYNRSNMELQDAPVLQKILLPGRMIWAEDARREFGELLRSEKPDVVHVHNTFMRISPSIFAACREAGIPVVQTLHNFRLLCPAATFFRQGKVCEECREVGLWRGIQHACYRESTFATAAVAAMIAVHRKAHTWMKGVTRFITLSQFARTKFVEGGLAGEKITVKPNFVAADPGTKDSQGEGAVFVGRLSPEKGVETLLEAWGRIPSRIPLRILGDGPLRRQLELAKSRLKLSHVAFEGHVSHMEALAAIKDARILVLPSECYENFPMTIVEALSCGTPVVCSRLGAMQELVTDGSTGLHFSPGSPDELADRVDWAFRHPHQTDEMGKAARWEYEQKYTADRNYSTLMNIYSQALSTCN